MTKKITNTAREVAERPLAAMIEMVIGGFDGAIERSEARGQRELVTSDVLPTNGLGLSHPPTRAVWEAIGVKIGTQVIGDEIFTNVTLPTGWKKRPTDHSMWSDLVDDKGRVRAHIFYKAAFYDRSANITPISRFRIERDYNRNDCRDVMQCHVLDCGSVVFASTEHTIPRVNGKQDWEATDRLEQKAVAECKAWLTEHGYPDFVNPDAYW